MAIYISAVNNSFPLNAFRIPNAITDLIRFYYSKHIVKGKAGIAVILSVYLLLKNKVFNCVFFGIIFNVSV